MDKLQKIEIIRNSIKILKVEINKLQQTIDEHTETIELNEFQIVELYRELKEK